MDKKRYRAVVYVGDSANDFCPSLVLRRCACLHGFRRRVHVDNLGNTANVLN